MAPRAAAAPCLVWAAAATWAILGAQAEEPGAAAASEAAGAGAAAAFPDWAAATGDGVGSDESGTCSGSSVQRRRRQRSMCSCRRRQRNIWSNPDEELEAPFVCGGGSHRDGEDSMVPRAVEPSACPAPAPSASGCGGACLCLFDIDRTLTGRQGDLERCPQNEVTGFTDWGYSHTYPRGAPVNATLSELAKVGISKTFCNKCYLGLVSAGEGSGVDSDWNRYIMESLVRGEVHDAFVAAHPEAKRWSTWSVRSPYVLKVPNLKKSDAAELVRKWYGRSGRDVCIQPQDVYFFGDRTENIKPFAEKGMNSREISCDSRDDSLYLDHARYPGSLVGYCGARPQEIQRLRGNFLCDDLPNETDMAQACDETDVIIP